MTAFQSVTPREDLEISQACGLELLAGLLCLPEGYGGVLFPGVDLFHYTLLLDQLSICARA